MAKSIIQTDITRCYICGRRGTSEDPLDKHHIFPSANRNLSEDFGLTVYIHHFRCHIFGKESVHADVNTAAGLKAEAQRICMEKYDMSVSDFISVFGRNYIDTKEEENHENTGTDQTDTASARPDGRH